MWILYAIASAFFAGVTSILAKCGIKKTDSNVATVIRTVVVLAFSWLMVLIVGSANTISSVTTKTWIFLVLSGMATGASWLCYFKALQIGDINKVVPIDKSSVVLTIVFAFLFLGESITLLKGVSVILIGLGTFLMIQKKETIQTEVKGYSWLIYAFLSALFASLTAILGKVGINGIESNLGTAMRTAVVLLMSIIVVFVRGSQREFHHIEKKEFMFIIVSGFATGASWLFYYKALQDGLASVVVPIDKLSILVTIAFSYIVFKERLSKKAILGLIMIVAGTLLMIV